MEVPRSLGPVVASSLRIHGEELEARDGPIAFQPTPKVALLATTPDGRWTALTRKFKKGEASLCRLCPRRECRAIEDICQIVVEGIIAEHQALLYSTVSLTHIG